MEQRQNFKEGHLEKLKLAQHAFEVRPPGMLG
jgi:hypothetical protein